MAAFSIHRPCSKLEVLGSLKLVDEVVHYPLFSFECQIRLIATSTASLPSTAEVLERIVSFCQTLAFSCPLH